MRGRFWVGRRDALRSWAGDFMSGRFTASDVEATRHQWQLWAATGYWARPEELL